MKTLPMVRGWTPSGLMVMAALLNMPGGVCAAERTQGRSMVISRHGIVASEHPLASQAGAMVLAEGGNAVDAAIAANAAMGVVSPMSCGMGGDLFAIVYEARTGRLHGLNASGWAPAGLSIDFLRQHGMTNMPQHGIHAVTIPGAVAGWDALRSKLGRKDFARLLAPAIQLAEEGFPVTEHVAGYWKGSEAFMSADPAAKKTFLPSGRAPAVGEIFRNPDLAWSLRQVVTGGRSAYYQGAVATKLLACSRLHGGTWAAADLRDYKVEWVDPISTTYHDWKIYEMPPQGQGIGALEMLNLMEQFPLRDLGFGSVEAFHAMIEAKKLAYADVLRYVADRRFAKVPVAGILDKSYARERAQRIDAHHAANEVPPGTPPDGGTDTTYLCAVDAEGNMVSLIQSNYAGFGSGLVADGTGFPLQNRGGLFSLDEHHPNALTGHKRPLHTIIPAFMTHGDVRMAFGIMGGWNQAQAHAQFVADIVDFSLNPQAALEAPRFTKLDFAGTGVSMESRIPEPVRARLTAMGHEIKVIGPFAQDVGGGQAVMRDYASGINYGASDPRKDGAAVPEPVSGRGHAPVP